uniref:C1q domain-containing protein n=1 Tax=Callorhinchus milii TaxID=7868 RepID=A0A4W3IPG9_CALMI
MTLFQYQIQINCLLLCNKCFLHMISLVLSSSSANKLILQLFPISGDKGTDGNGGSPGRQGPPGMDGQCPSDCISDKGDTGEKGNVGLAGPMGVKDGEKGEPGNVGDVGPQGNMGPQGVQGEKGDMGEKGVMGEIGDPGPCSPTVQSAFSAARAIGDGFPNPYYPIPFRNVFYNNQKHFNPGVGVYTAPVNGTYVFSYHLSISKNPIQMALFKNRETLVKTANIATKDQASQMIVLYLAGGDKIWLQVKDSIDNGMYASSETDSTFSGFLLYPDSCNQVVSRAYADDMLSGSNC